MYLYVGWYNYYVEILEGKLLPVKANIWGEPEQTHTDGDIEICMYVSCVYLYVSP